MSKEENLIEVARLISSGGFKLSNFSEYEDEILKGFSSDRKFLFDNKTTASDFGIEGQGEKDFYVIFDTHFDELQSKLPRGAKLNDESLLSFEGNIKAYMYEAEKIDQILEKPKPEIGESKPLQAKSGISVNGMELK